MFGLRLIDNARQEFHRFWAVRISLAYGVFTGVACVLAAFTETLNPWLLVAISIVVNTALIPLARMVKQADAKPAPAPEVAA